MLKTTSHLSKRRKRVGLSKKAMQRFLTKAFEEGLRLDDVRSKPTLYRYLRSILKEGYYPILYDHYIIIVSEDNDYGVTILRMSNRYFQMFQQILGGKRYAESYRYRASQEAEDGQEYMLTHKNRRKLYVR